MTTYGDWFTGFGGMTLGAIAAGLDTINKGRFVVNLTEKIFAVNRIQIRLGSANKAHYHQLGYDVYGKSEIVVRVEHLPESSGVKLPVICPRCNQKRIITKQQSTVYGHTYCKACVKYINNFQDVGNRRFGRLVAVRAVSKDNNNATQWLCECDCGNNTVTSITRLNNGLTNSCGCLRVERTIKAVSGPKNVNYNPDLTKHERLKMRVVPEYREWQRLVKERDYFTCRACGQRGGKLASHHLNGWDAFPEQRFDVGNGITLCVRCHYDFHKKHRRGGNTVEQFREWMGNHK